MPSLSWNLENSANELIYKAEMVLAFPGGPGVKNLPADAGNTGLIPGLGGCHKPPSHYASVLQLLTLRAVTAEACTP